MLVSYYTKRIVTRTTSASIVSLSSIAAANTIATTKSSTTTKHSYHHHRRRQLSVVAQQQSQCQAFLGWQHYITQPQQPSPSCHCHCYSHCYHRSFASASSHNDTNKHKHIRSYDKQYINGKWTNSTNNSTSTPTSSTNTNTTSIDVFDSNTGRVVATVPKGTNADTLEAIAAAKAALPNWSRQTTAKERIEKIKMFLKHFHSKERREEINDRLMVELGCTAKLARTAQSGSVPFHADALLELLEDTRSNGNDNNNETNASAFEWEYAAGKCTVVREPIGVVGAITPWNYPLSQIALKLIPALIAGCTVVLKPSEVTPLVAYSIAEVIDETNCFPPGVFNMVVGEGPECAEVLARHPDVDLVSFTGSTTAGQILTRVAADSGTLKPIQTELGGKSAAILLDDADFHKVVPAFVKQLTSNSGQSCNALSRMLVPREHRDQVLEIAKSTMEEEIVGCTVTNPEATMGPLVSKAQYDRVVAYIRKGIAEGARVVTGGPEKPQGVNEHGYFVKPTLFANVTNQMTIAREEIFGPVLCVIPYDTEQEAIRLANETPYGLNNAVASRDLKKALRVASQLESGMVMVNTTYLDAKAPFGGYKLSGNAREGGLSGLEEFLITKVVNVPLEEYRAAMGGTNTT